mgnify:CR=1 FL=1
MIDRLIDDPAFLPITITLLILVIVAIWQKLDRFILPLVIMYVVYAVITGISITEDNDIIKSAELVQSKIEINGDSIILKIVDETSLSDTVSIEVEEQKVDTIDEEPVQLELGVNSLLMCESMIDSLRKPVNARREFPVTLSRVYCYSGIRNALSERTILYEWYFQDNYIDTIPIKIGRSVHWRSWTYKTITDAQIGEWFVVLRDEISNTALDTIHFTIIDE